MFVTVEVEKKLCGKEKFFLSRDEVFYNPKINIKILNELNIH